ncbi:hypothetical protein BJX64DRAFT_184393 [Aspergillus heterothallicus]
MMMTQENLSSAHGRSCRTFLIPTRRLHISPHPKCHVKRSTEHPAIKFWVSDALPCLSRSSKPHFAHITRLGPGSPQNSQIVNRMSIALFAMLLRDDDESPERNNRLMRRIVGTQGSLGQWLQGSPASTLSKRDQTLRAKFHSTTTSGEEQAQQRTRHCGHRVRPDEYYPHNVIIAIVPSHRLSSLVSKCLFAASRNPCPSKPIVRSRKDDPVIFSRDIPSGGHPCLQLGAP